MEKIITKRADGSIRVQYRSTKPSKTQQQFKDDVDINNILRKYKKGIEITHLARSKGVYADLTTLPDYHTSMNTVLKANDAFMTLPSHVRKQFENDPSQLISFLNDPKNYDEAVKLGLVQEKPMEPKTMNKNNEPAPTPSEPKPQS